MLLGLLGRGPVLELGCGNGKLLRPLRQAGVEVVGLDVSFHALRRLEEGVLGDAARLPFDDGAFSAVLDIHCTGHLLAAGRAQAAAEKARVLRAGGTLVVERLGTEDLRATKGDEVEAGTRRLADGRSTHFCTPEAIATEHPEFHVVDASEARRETRYGNRPVTRQSHRLVLRKAA